MPGMTGVEVAAEFRQFERNQGWSPTVIVGVSAFPEEFEGPCMQVQCLYYVCVCL
jgi:CheY-like chemotaxis protein